MQIAITGANSAIGQAILSGTREGPAQIARWRRFAPSGLRPTPAAAEVGIQLTGLDEMIHQSLEEVQ